MDFVPLLKLLVFFSIRNQYSAVIVYSQSSSTKYVEHTIIVVRVAKVAETVPKCLRSFLELDDMHKTDANHLYRVRYFRNASETCDMSAESWNSLTRKDVRCYVTTQQWGKYNGTPAQQQLFTQQQRKCVVTWYYSGIFRYLYFITGTNRIATQISSVFLSAFSWQGL
jgi:hypothetical protein